jgi:hypothetical protein
MCEDLFDLDFSEIIKAIEDFLLNSSCLHLALLNIVLIRMLDINVKKVL